MYGYLQRLAVGLEQVVLDQNVYDGRFMEEFNEAEFKLKAVITFSCLNWDSNPLTAKLQSALLHLGTYELSLSLSLSPLPYTSLSLSLSCALLS